MATFDSALLKGLQAHLDRDTPASRRAPRLPSSRSLYEAPKATAGSLLTREALSFGSFGGGDSLGLSMGGKPWWDCSEVAVVHHEKARDQLAPSPAVVHLEHTNSSMEQETPYGSTTSVNSLGLELVAPDWTNTRAPSEASSDDSMALPGAFDESLMSTSYSSSALGLQFDEDAEVGSAFLPFAGSDSSPLALPLCVPPPSPALVLESLSLLPRKRPAVTALPTPPLSRDEPTWPSAIPSTPRKSVRKSSIPLPSLPTTPISLPTNLSRFTSSLQAAIQSPRCSRVELDDAPDFPLLPTPEAQEEDSGKTPWTSYSHLLHSGVTESSPDTPLASLASSPQAIPTPAFIPIASMNSKRLRRT